MGLGDFNGDGKIDLAVRECPGTTTDRDIAVYRGKGNGAFTLETVLPSPGSASRTHSLVVTDLNRDGKLDIATAALSGASSAPTANFTVFFGEGNGSFGPPVVTSVAFTVPAGSRPLRPALWRATSMAKPRLIWAWRPFVLWLGLRTVHDDIFIDNGAGVSNFKGKLPTAPPMKGQTTGWQPFYNDLA